jgi:hypothetical protein
MIPMNNAPNDTEETTEQAYLKMLRAASTWRKATMVDSLTRTCQELAAAGIRMRHPGASAEDIRMRVAALWLSCDLMIRVFQWDPDLRGY